MQVAERFAESLAELGPFEPSPTIAIALSGGADSMALTLLAEAWVKQRGGRIVTLTVDHGLRAESKTEAAQVGAWMQARGIEHHILTPLHTPAGNNLMQAARRWRYRALAEWCRTQGILHCLIAHHADDQLETSILNRARGVTEDGGAGMSALRLYRGVRFLRPLLNVRTQELRDYLTALHVAWVEDPTNANLEYARARARQSLSAKDFDVQHRLVRDDAETRMQRDKELAAAAIHCVLLHPAGYATLDRRGWMTLDAMLRSQLLADLIACIGGHIHRPRHHETAWLEKALHEPKGKQTLGECLIEWREEEVSIAREPARVEPPITLSGHGTTLWDRRFRIHYRLTEPVTLGALGIPGRKNSGLKAPPATPALWHLDELLAIPHMGWSAGKLPDSLQIHIGFAPAKPLAARSFWWFTGA